MLSVKKRQKIPIVVFKHCLPFIILLHFFHIVLNILYYAVHFNRWLTLYEVVGFIIYSFYLVSVNVLCCNTCIYIFQTSLKESAHGKKNPEFISFKSLLKLNNEACNLFIYFYHEILLIWHSQWKIYEVNFFFSIRLFSDVDKQH